MSPLSLSDLSEFMFRSLFLLSSTSTRCQILNFRLPQRYSQCNCRTKGYNDNVKWKDHQRIGYIWDSFLLKFTYFLLNLQQIWFIYLFLYDLWTLRSCMITNFFPKNMVELFRLDSIIGKSHILSLIFTLSISHFLCLYYTWIDGWSMKKDNLGEHILKSHHTYTRLKRDFRNLFPRKSSIYMWEVHLWWR